MHSIFYKIECAPSEDSDQPAHPRSLIRVFTGHCVDSQGSKTSSGGQRRLWSDCANAQTDPRFRWAHMQSWRKCCVPVHIIFFSHSAQRGRTAICIAFLGSKKGVLAYLLEKLPVEKTETFIKVSNIRITVSDLCSKTSMTRTPVTRLPWLIRTCCWIP